MSLLKGIFGAMCTPLKDNGEIIDLDSYYLHIDELIEAGIHGLVLCSGTGEYAYLNDEEKSTLIREGVKHIDGRCPTIAQTTFLSTSDCIIKAKIAEDEGASAIMVMPSFLEPPTEEGVLRHYEKIADVVKIPIVMYNVPQQAAPISEELYRKLIKIKNLDYIKDSSGDFLSLQKFIQSGGGVLSGVDSFMPYALLNGCAGMICGTANFMPHECVNLYNLIEEKKFKEAIKLWKLMEPICLWLWRNAQNIDFITAVKAATNLTGRKVGLPRKPLLEAPDHIKEELSEAMSSLPINGGKK
tara:strand:+ start:2368 stop:3264 length:897 start_codon:yes stop_codon:yes gene_type:complete